MCRTILSCLGLCLALAACQSDADFASHRQADENAATGSRLAGVETGAESNADTTNNPSIAAFSTAGSRH